MGGAFSRVVHIEGASAARGASGMLCSAVKWYALPPEEACKAELARLVLESSGEH